MGGIVGLFSTSASQKPMSAVKNFHSLTSWRRKNQVTSGVLTQNPSPQ